MNNIKINNITRVSKRTARSMYERYYTVELIPCLISPRSMWMQGYEINKLKEEDQGFDDIANMYAWYNCNNETGLYVAYYVDEGDLLRYKVDHKIMEV